MPCNAGQATLQDVTHGLKMRVETRGVLEDEALVQECSLLRRHSLAIRAHRASSDRHLSHLESLAVAHSTRKHPGGGGLLVEAILLAGDGEARPTPL